MTRRGAEAGGDLEVRTARSLPQVDRLEAAWRAMDRQVAYPLAHFGWIRAALTSVDRGARPHVAAAFRGEKLAALAPLVEMRVRGVRRLVLAGVSSLFEPLDLVWRDLPALECLVAELARSRKPLLLARVPLDSESLGVLRRGYARRAWLCIRGRDLCPYIELDESWKEPEHHLSSRRRSDWVRARRRAERRGAVSTEIHVPEPAELDGLLQAAFDVEERSWKGEAGTALARDALRAAFYRSATRDACLQRRLRICFLRIGGSLAAMQLALEHRGGFWLLKVGYDARFADCSPGLLLLRDTIRHAAESGLARYEFLGHPEPWIHVWTKAQRPHVAVRVYPFGLHGLAALCADALVHGVQRWKRA